MFMKHLTLKRFTIITFLITFTLVYLNIIPINNTIVFPQFIMNIFVFFILPLIFHEIKKISTTAEKINIKINKNLMKDIMHGFYIISLLIIIEIILTITYTLLNFTILLILIIPTFLTVSILLSVMLLGLLNITITLYRITNKNH